MLLNTRLDLGRVLLIGIDAVELVLAQDLQRDSGAQLALAEALACDRTGHVVVVVVRSGGGSPRGELV